MNTAVHKAQIDFRDLTPYLTYSVNVDCVKFEYVVLAKYHHMLIFEFDLLTKQHILILCKKLL
jgi:hypothetical protein